MFTLISIGLAVVAVLLATQPVRFIDPISIGSIAGTAVGSGLQLYEGNKAEKAQEAANPRPKRRRLAKALEMQQQAFAQNQAAMGSLAESAFDYAARLR